MTAPARVPIRDAVAAHLAENLSGMTRQSVVEHYAKKEADKRAAALIAGIDKLTQMQRDLNNVRPQVTAFNADGEPVGEPTFTKEQVDNRKKLRENIDKLEKALNKADDNGDFGDLYNLTK